MGGFFSRPEVLTQVGSGPYQVGGTDLMLDGSVLGEEGLFLRLYYPTDEKINGLSDYPNWLPKVEYCTGLGEFIGIPPLIMRFHLAAFVGEKRCDCIQNAELSLKSEQWPVVVFSHGLGGCRTYYSKYCTSLASHGYIVAAIEHRDRSACWTYQLSDESEEQPLKMRLVAGHPKDEFEIRNPQLEKREAECQKMYKLFEHLNAGEMPGNVIMGEEFDWSQFKGKLDMSSAYIAGHSFGGATAIASSGKGTTFQKAVALDAWQFPLDLTQKRVAQLETMFLNVGNWQWKENFDGLKTVLENNENNLMLTLDGAVHQGFSDFPFIFLYEYFKKSFGLKGTTDPSRCLQAAVELTVQFFREGKAGAHALKDEKFSDFIKNKNYCREVYK